MKRFSSLLLPLVLTVLLFLGVWLLAKYQYDIRSRASDLGNQFVSRSGTKFFLGGQEFKFVGFNLFDAAGRDGAPYSCPQANGWFPRFTDSELDAALKTMKKETGATVLRFWAFQKYTNDGTDFTGIDKLITLAKTNGFKILPVLEDGPGYCTEPGGGGNAHMEKWKYQNDTWYTEGYKVVNSGYKLSYRDFVKTIVERYKNEPTIFGWMMVNEADTSLKVNGKSPLVNFATDIGTLIKSIDQNHLITVGTQSNGASGATGQDFLDVYGLSVIDFAEAHDWGYWGNDNEAVPGGFPTNPLSAECLKTYQAKIGCSFAQAIQVLQKPMVVGEAGIAASDATTRAKRATLMDAKMKAFFNMGGAGYLYWQWNKVIDAQKYDVLANTNDPLLPVMKKYAGIDILPASPSGTPLPTSLPTVKPTLTPIATVRPSIAPTIKPTQTPKVTLTPQPTVKPSFTPRATAKPTSTPTPAPATSTLEGEAMTMIFGTGRIAENSLLLLTNATARGQINGPIKKLVIRAKAQICLGSPHINVKVDGKFVLDRNIYNSTFTDYNTDSLEYLRLGSGTHTIEVIYNNDAYFRFCDRNVFIDSIKAI